MTEIKTILVPFYGNEKELPALEAAFMLAKQHDSHVHCLHISPSANLFGYGDPMLPVHNFAEIKESIEKELQNQAQRAQTWFEDTAKKYHVPVTTQLDASHKQAAASWRHEVDTQADEAIAHAGRLADVIIISRIITEQHESYHSAIVASLFETGRPVMIMPTGETPKTIGKHIAIAWDASAEAAHTVAEARPLLKQAEKVRIITVDEKEKTGPIAQELALYLLVHNVKSDHVSIQTGSLSIGSAIMEEALKEGADMIVMGAFAHSRIRQMLLGGATSFMLDHAKLPIFMAH
jgi:nucleotide-binding universal stress UspA family protein